MARKKKKQTKISLLVGQAGLVLVGAYLAAGILFNHMRINEKRQELQNMQERLQLQQQQNDELSRVLESGSDLEIIERVARDRLGYAKPNERVFVDVNGQ